MVHNGKTIHGVCPLLHVVPSITVLAKKSDVQSVTAPYSGGFRGGSGGSIEPPFLRNSKFLQFVPPKKFMCNFEPAYH